MDTDLATITASNILASVCRNCGTGVSLRVWKRWCAIRGRWRKSKGWHRVRVGKRKDLVGGGRGGVGDEAVTLPREMLGGERWEDCLHRGCRNAYTNIFSPPWPENRGGGRKVQTFHRDRSGSIFTNSVGKQTQPHTRTNLHEHSPCRDDMMGIHGWVSVGALCLSHKSSSKLLITEIISFEIRQPGSTNAFLTMTETAPKLSFPFFSQRFSFNHRFAPPTKAHQNPPGGSESAVNHGAPLAATQSEWTSNHANAPPKHKEIVDSKMNADHKLQDNNWDLSSLRFEKNHSTDNRWHVLIY